MYKSRDSPFVEPVICLAPKKDALLEHIGAVNE